MGRTLTDAQVAHYRERGYLSPLVAFAPDRARSYRERLEALEREHGGALPHDARRKMHLYLKWVDEIVHDPRVLDAVEDLIGPDILLYHVTLWTKAPHSEDEVRWHQDSTYFGLSPAEHVTAWVALSTSDVESGGVQVVPGSHLQGQVVHRMRERDTNMLRGQEIDVPDDAPLDTMTLRAGEFSLHHTHLHHRSLPNRSHDRRIGLGISYIPAHCRCSAPQRLSAMCVRGHDRYHHFDPETRPESDRAPQALERHADAMRRWHAARETLIAAAHAHERADAAHDVRTGAGDAGR